ncbi:MAG: tetratricopeptide repeat protein [Chloroflexales bacterium]
MSGQLTPIRIFVAGPSDVHEELKRLRKVLEELNARGNLAEQQSCVLQVMDWHDAVSGMGPSGEVVLSQFPPEKWDMFIGILWMRFGTSSSGKDQNTSFCYDSGTQEEFMLAYSAWKEKRRPYILVYKCQRPVQPDNIDIEQWAKVRAFWENFAHTGKHPGLYGTYVTAEELEDRVRNDIVRLLPQLKPLPSSSLPSVAPVATHLENEDSEFAATDIEWTRYDRDGVGRFFNAAGRDADDMSQLFDILRDWSLICSTGDKWVFTKVGALLLGSADRIVRYGYTDVRIEDVKGNIRPLLGYPLSHLVFELMDVLNEELGGIWEDPARRDTEGRPLQISRYPRTAIVESVVNFVIHRDYTSNDIAWVKICSDRIEMTNPGISPYSETELLSEKELHPQYKTNPYIIHIFTRTGLNQRQGGGIKRILQALRENGNLLPDGKPALEIKSDKELNRFGLTVYARSKPYIASIPITQSPSPPLAPGSAPLKPALVIGRDHDLKVLKQRVGISASGTAIAPLKVLIAMRGWPGVGKTTLAAALAHDPEINERFPDGVLWASLGQQPSLFGELAAWGRALGVPDLNQARTIEEVSNLLRGMLKDKRYLLIVDDAWQAEHVLPFNVGGSGCALLITTRLPEVARVIASTPDDVYVLGVLSEVDALALLRTLAPTVVAQNEATSRELVNDLEGLPLAIQVAGRLLYTEASYGFGVTQLLADIREGAKLIEAYAPADRADIANETTPTIAALLKKSTDRLDAHTLDCFAYLGAFAPKPATFDAEAMKAVWEVDDPRPTIRTLVNRGLLEPTDNGRFWMHAILVVHARSFLTEEDALRSPLEHARHYAQVAQQTNLLYKEGGTQLLAGLALFDRERIQIDSGWEWARQHIPTPETDKLLLSYTDATTYVGDLRYHKRSEQIPQLEAALQAARRQSLWNYELATLINLGDAYRLLGDYHRASTFLDQGLRIAREIGDQINEANVLNNLGLVYTDQGSLHLAIVYHDQALAIIRKFSDHRSEGIILGNLGNICANLGDLHRAIDYHKQALELSHALGDRRGEGTAEINLGSAYANLGDPRRAIEYFERALSISLQIGDRRNESTARSNLGLAYTGIGNKKRAISYLESALLISCELGDRRSEAIASWNLGLAYEQQDNFANAIRLMQVYVDFARETGFADIEKCVEKLEQVRRRSRELQS